jgi:hypothetical protein
MKHRVSLPAIAGAAFALSAGTALAAGPVCSAEYERVGVGEYEWRGTILADDGRIYEFAINSIAQAGTIATFAAGEGGARGAYEQLIRLASESGTIATAEAIAALQAMVALAYDADVTVTTGPVGGGTWSILCFPAGPVTDPVLIERRGDSIGLNPAADDLRAALVALDPAFALETAPTEPAAKPR